MEKYLCGETAIDKNGQELKQHGTVLFPVAFYSADLSVERVGWHWHNELELAWVAKGSVMYGTDTCRCRLEEGDMIFINQDVLHASWTAGGPCVLHTVVFHPRLIGGMDTVFWQNYVAPLLDRQGLKSLKLEGNSAIGAEARQEAERARASFLERPAGYEFGVREALSRILLKLLQCAPASPAAITERSLRNGQRIKQMLQFIQYNYGENLTVEDIAASAAISESECLRCFHETIGIPPNQYLRQVRLKKAAELLRNTEEKISDIAAACGFQEMSYFAKAFRGSRGCTPREYRAKHGAK